MISTFTFFDRTKQDEPHQPAGALVRHFLPKLACLLAALTLTGCALSDAAHDPLAPRAILQPWTTLTGGQAATSGMGMAGAGYITLSRPTALSVRDTEVYLADAGLNRIYRYSPSQQSLFPYTNLPVNPGMSIYAASDRSVYITDPTRAEVLHFRWDGTQLPSFVSPGNLSRPVAVTVDESNGQVLVADGLFDHFIVFNSLGTTLSVIKPQQTIAIAAIAAGPDGIYVTDRLAKRVVVLGRDGAFRYALGSKGQGEPGVIAVSRDNLVFVSDNFDQTIKVYRGQKTEGGDSLLAKVGGFGAAPGRFNGISGLAVDGRMLYVTDTQNSRVQTMLINR